MKVYLVVLNWNGKDFIRACLDSLREQSYSAEIIVVDNGSTDGSIEVIERNYPYVRLLKQPQNHGFAGGVNIGIKYAIKNGADAVALLNNDAVADKDWLKHLVNTLKKRKETAAVTGKLLSADGKRVDNTGDEYSIWGLTIPRQRGLPENDADSKESEVFGACAGAALYRVRALEDVGFFDEKFFAYYEDSDLNFRLQLKGWETFYQPVAVAYHTTGSTSSKIPGFVTFHTIKNLPMLFWKNVPLGLMPKMLPRFCAVYTLVFFSSLAKGKFGPTLKGFAYSIANVPHTVNQRANVQKNRKTDSNYIWSVLYQDLPPNASGLHKLRSIFTLGKH